MRVCLMLEGQEGIGWEQWLALAHAAEAAGLEALFRSDHYRSIVRGDPAGSLDAWTILGALAARTERLRLGTMVSPVTFRPAPVLAKAVVTVDHISGGRVELGIGAGWYEPEHSSYGFAFPPPRERFDLLEGQLEQIERQWTHAADVWPKPVQKPRPPVIVGGRARPRSLRAAIRFADEYNTVSPTVEEARVRRHALDDAALAAGRAPLRFSMMIGCVVGADARETEARLNAWRRITGGDRPPLVGTVAELAGQLRAYESAGVERVMLQHLDHDDLDSVALLGVLAAEVR
jgi:alkanesulfonate monooxygenase SsuD/methylene tetrahydromethanopterin reductase-like flavin-dependent oxidoreductase (luciferase family)